MTYEYKGHKNLYLALGGAKTKLYNYLQKAHKSNTLHYNIFATLVEVVEHHGGAFCRDEALVEIEGNILVRVLTLLLQVHRHVS